MGKKQHRMIIENKFQYGDTCARYDFHQLYLHQLRMSLFNGMGEEGREELAPDIFKENVSTVGDGEVREDSGVSKKPLSKFVNEDETKEQEETREQIQVQERIQVHLCFFTA